MLVDFGYFELDVPEGWLIRYEQRENGESLNFHKDRAKAELRLYLTPPENPSLALELQYSRTLAELQRNRGHVSDLSEENDYEILFAIDESQSETRFAHLFFANCGNLIIEMLLTDYLETHEIEIRTMLSSCVKKEIKANSEDDTKLELAIITEGWNRLGDIFFMVSSA